MDLTHRKTIKDLLKKHGARAEKKLGQHFILSKKTLARMIEAAEIKKNDTIIEIGPGLGTLTQELAESGAKIIAIEKDPLMLEVLRETLKDFKSIKIIAGDARKFSIFNFSRLAGSRTAGQFSNYKIIANLPYNVATFLIHQWLELKNPPKTMILMIQKEVAQRIAANPPRMNLLAASVQFYADVKIIDYVKKSSFWPQPKVDSAIIKIIPKRIDVFPAIANKTAYFRIAKAGFSQPRKQLAGNLAKKLNVPKEKIISALKKIGAPELSRAENLSVEQWISLVPKLIHN